MFRGFKEPFLIAEISANHCGKLDIAKKLIKTAKKNGADAVKLQTYKADTMTIKSNKSLFKIKKGIWKGYNLWDLYNQASTPYEWHEELFSYAKKVGITIFSTPFDESAVDLLEELRCPFYKVASFEMTDLPLIKKIAMTGKPMIISTGMADFEEIKKTFNVAKKYGSGNIALLYCVSNYPSKKSDFNLNNIKILMKNFNCYVGLSDHSVDKDIAISAVSIGASIFEKHIALDNQSNGLDIDFSLKGKALREYRKAIDDTFELLGKNTFVRKKSELKNKFLRRSIFVVENIKKGDRFTKNNIRRIRPGNGLPPEYYERLLGKRSPFNYKFGQPLKKNILKKLKIVY